MTQATIELLSPSHFCLKLRVLFLFSVKSRQCYEKILEIDPRKESLFKGKKQKFLHCCPLFSGQDGP